MKIRKMAAVLIAALTLGTTAVSVSMPACATIADGYYVTTANSYLTLRAGASKYTQELGRLGFNTSVRVDHYEGDWAYVYVPSMNKYGYVYDGYITPDGDSADFSGEPFYLSDGVTKTCCVRDGYLALRSAPATDASNEIGKVYAGQQVHVQWDTDNGFAFVYVPALDRTGYVNASYLR